MDRWEETNEQEETGETESDRWQSTWRKTKAEPE